MDNTWVDTLMAANIELFLQALVNAAFIYCHFNIYRRLRNNLTNFLLRNDGIFSEEQTQCVNDTTKSIFKFFAYIC